MKDLNNILHVFVTAMLLALSHPLHASTSIQPSDTLQSVANQAKATTRIIRGDLNNDGNRSVADVSAMVQNILANSDDIDISVGDMDNNGVLTVTDVTILVNIILGEHYTDYENPDLYIDDAEGGDPGTGL